MLGFWMYQGFEYSSVLNMSGFWIYYVCTGSWVCLNVIELFLNMPEYVGIYINMPKFAWMAFVLHVTNLIPWLLEFVDTYFNKVYSLKEQETVFFEETRCDLLCSSWMCLICFLFRLVYFTRKISSLLLPLGVKGPRAVNLDIPL